MARLNPEGPRLSSEILNRGVLVTYTPADNIAYFEFAPRRRGRRANLKIAPGLVVDWSPVGKRLMGIEIDEVSGYWDGIVDPTKLRQYREERKGRVSPGQVLEVVDRLVTSEPQIAEDPRVKLIRETIEDYLDLKAVEGIELGKKDGAVTLEQLERELNLPK